ncbi:MAG: hypothetical protein GVY32_10455 [Gammaproteobacteria bacterium]|nr:hypothetical protein [Gammaproteobacteria bacterium]
MALLTLVAAFAPLATGMPLPGRIAGALLAIALGAIACRRLLRPRFDSLRLDGERVCMGSPDGKRLEGPLTGSPFVSPLFVGFRWHPSQRRLPASTGVFSEQMDAQDYRRLCAALRQGEPR